jgi:anti-sigma factor (TIGR02949 family)
VNCRQALEKLYDYLDKELVESEQKKLEQHLELCSDCLRKYNIEKSVQEAITSRLHESYDTAPLKARILAEIDKMEGGGRSGRIFYLLAPLAAAAAIAVAFLFPLISADNRYEVYSAVAPFADTHSDCLSKALDFRFKSSNPQVLDSCMADLRGLLPRQLFEFKSQDIKIAAATISQLPGGNEPLLEYIAFGDSVSLFVNYHNSIDTSPFREITVGGEKMLVGSCTNYRYVIWECGDTQCIAVSRLPEKELVEFASAF